MDTQILSNLINSKKNVFFYQVYVKLAQNEFMALHKLFYGIPNYSLSTVGFIQLGSWYEF